MLPGSIPAFQNSHLPAVYFFVKIDRQIGFVVKMYALLNAKTIPEEEQQSYYLTLGWEYKRVCASTNGISPKVNVRTRLEFELTSMLQFKTLPIALRGIQIDRQIDRNNYSKHYKTLCKLFLA